MDGAVCNECEITKKKNQECFENSQEHWKNREIQEQKEAEEERIKNKKEREETPERFMKFIPIKFRNKSLDNFSGSEEIKKILKNYSDGFIHKVKYSGGDAIYSEGLVQYPGSVLLIGKTGCGKTHLAVSVVTELTKRGFDVRCNFITAPELLLEIRSTFDKSKVYDSWDTNICKTEEDVINKYSHCELLILDDLGAEKTSDFTIQSLYLIIDRRNRELRPTIVTTNLSLEEIEEKIDARMASRLADMKVIKLNMPDYRKKR